MYKKTNSGGIVQPQNNERNIMTQLVKYEAAKYALQQARSVDEVKNIHDVSAAMKAYAIQAQDKQMEIDASEIRIRAERRLGEMIRTQKETVGLATGGQPYQSKPTSTSKEPVERPTLSDVGISKKLSSRSQAIASIPEEEFEETLTQHREEQQAVTAKTMERLSKRGQEIVHKKTFPVSDADQYAMMAILQLERIQDDDPEAIRQLEKVEQWIVKTKERINNEN
jgi:hypothetical protein